MRAKVHILFKVLVIPFAWTSSLTNDVSGFFVNNTSEWIGEIGNNEIGTYTDSFLLLIFGGIPWQVG